MKYEAGDMVVYNDLENEGFNGVGIVLGRVNLHPEDDEFKVLWSDGLVVSYEDDSIFVSKVNLE